MIVRSNPPGAAVQIDNQPIGVTPASTDYVYYGTREVKLSMPGYETLTVNQPLPTPWYALPGVDFFTETLWPFTVNDRRELNYNLQRQRMAPAAEIIARGEQLRRQAAPQGAAPIGTAVSPQPTTAPMLPPPPAGTFGQPLFDSPAQLNTVPPASNPAPILPPASTAPATSPLQPAPSFGAPTLPAPAPTPNPPTQAQPFRY